MSPPAQALLLHPPPDVINRRSRHFGGRAEIHGCTTAVGPGMTSSSCAEGRPGPGSATTPVMNSLWWNRFAARKLVWSTPIDATPASLAGSWTRGVLYSTTARITVPHPTPSMTATDATSCWSSPTSRQACLRARSVSELRAGCRCWSRSTSSPRTRSPGSARAAGARRAPPDDRLREGRE